MAANRIKGITVEIGGDTTKLQDALKSVNSQIKNTQSQLKDVEKLLKLDPGNTELLAQKEKLLSEAVEETRQKLQALKTASEQANKALAEGKISQEQYDALQLHLAKYQLGGWETKRGRRPNQTCSLRLHKRPLHNRWRASVAHQYGRSHAGENGIPVFPGRQKLQRDL